MSDVVKERGLIGTPLATVLDADGRDLKFDICEDETQNEKFEETIDLLLAAGYFRARIKGISAFDKVVGGMVWCISFCDYDINVDLLFHENLSIGQKIALTEKIVKVLKKMKCSCAIEPHQIQGLDFVHIFPVIQWLVKEAISSREQSGDIVQSFAEYQFDKDHVFTDTTGQKTSEITINQNFNILERMYRRNDRHIDEEEEEASRVQKTILEYEGVIGAFEETNQTPRDLQEAQHVESVNAPFAVGLSKVDENIAFLNTADIKVAIKEASIEKSLDIKIDSTAIVKPHESERAGSVEDTSLEDLKERKVYLIQLQDELRNEFEKSKLRLNSTKSSFEQLVNVEKEWKAKNSDIEQLESSADKKQMELLKNLLEQHDQVKKAEHEFKERCKKEASLIEAEIEKLSTQREMPSDQNEVTSLKMKRDSLTKELAESRLKTAAINRKVAALQRKLDDAPSRLELNQYQRRFLELYNQIAFTQKETKKYYILYNTLHDVRNFMEKEINLLNSVYDNYETGLYTDQMKLQFVSQLEQTFDGIRQTKSRSEKKMGEEKLRRDTLRETYQELLDRQRLYYKVVSDFQEECRKNEILTAKLDKMGIQT